MVFWDDGRDSKRTLGIRDKQILYRNAKGKCQNPGCGKPIDFDEMQVGHKTAWSKGGNTTFKNSVCLCYRCNKLQGTDSWAVFLKKQGIEDPKAKMKESAKEGLENLSVTQLKQLATKKHVKVTGAVVESLFDSDTKAPTKSQYIKKLSSIVTDADLKAIPEPTEKPIKKKKRQTRSTSIFGIF